jgi:predicted NBD/HSP70 family sugar kinase|tara:strand:+ start:513 stop:758 length:246 start_codon:yes stop_codon:yes gene_type:complete
LEGKDFSIAIDIGGTFTDSVIANKNGKIFKVAKTASTPANPSEGFMKSVANYWREIFCCLTSLCLVLPARKVCYWGRRTLH